jgi:signal transduction histidine kinase
MQVADDGCGFELSLGSRGLGLKIMAARARALGITLDIQSRPTCGTVVKLRLEQP